MSCINHQVFRVRQFHAVRFRCKINFCPSARKRHVCCSRRKRHMQIRNKPLNCDFTCRRIHCKRTIQHSSQNCSVVKVEPLQQTLRCRVCNCNCHISFTTSTCSVERTNVRHQLRQTRSYSAIRRTHHQRSKSITHQFPGFRSTSKLSSIFARTLKRRIVLNSFRINTTFFARQVTVFCFVERQISDCAFQLNNANLLCHF